MMAGAVATLGAQWGLIPRLGLNPRSLILGGVNRRGGLTGTMISQDLYEITIGFAVASLGFGFTRPGFTAAPRSRFPWPNRALLPE